jgi:hypothetical protein
LGKLEDYNITTKLLSPVLHFGVGGTQVGTPSRTGRSLLVQAGRHVRLQSEGSRDSRQTLPGISFRQTITLLYYQLDIFKLKANFKIKTLKMKS